MWGRHLNENIVWAVFLVANVWPPSRAHHKAQPVGVGGRVGRLNQWEGEAPPSNASKPSLRLQSKEKRTEAVFRMRPLAAAGVVAAACLCRSSERRRATE